MRLRKAVSLILLAMLLSLLFTGCAPAPVQTPVPAPDPAPAPVPVPEEAAMPELVVRFASPSPGPPALMARGFDHFQKRAAELSGGKITFENHWGGALLSGHELLEGVGTGVADMSMGLPVLTPGKTPLGAFNFVFPFRPDDPRLILDVMRTMYETVPALHEEMAQHNIKVLYRQVSVNFDITSKMPIRNMAELKGKRIAAAGAIFPRMVEAAGAVPVSMPGAERYVAFERGVIDGQILDIAPVVGEKHYEVARNYSYVDIGAANVIKMWVNLDFWNALTPAQRDVFTKAAAEAEEWHVEETLRTVAEYKKTMEEAGVTFHEFPEAERQKWIEMLPDIPAEWAQEMEAKGLPGWHIVETFIRLCEEAGHSWEREWGKR